MTEFGQSVSCGHRSSSKPLSKVAFKMLHWRWRPGEESMKSSTKDQIEGKLRELKGKVKEKTGQATKNPNLAAQGQDEKIAGKIQRKVGQIEKVFEK